MYSTNHFPINRRDLTVGSSAATAGEREIFSDGYETTLSGARVSFSCSNSPQILEDPTGASQHVGTEAAPLVQQDFVAPFVKYTLKMRAVDRLSHSNMLFMLSPCRI